MSIQSATSGNVQSNAAVPVPRKVSGQKTTVAPKQVKNKRAAQSAQSETRSQGLDKRLAAYARNVDARLKGAIENADSPREKAALEAAQKDFHSKVFRLDAAFLAPGRKSIDMKTSDAASRVLDALTGDVRGALGASVDVQA